MNRHYYMPGLLLLLAIALNGCSTTPGVDRFFGTSYELARESQRVDPKAGIKPQPLTGIEGNVGKLVMDRYKTGFAEAAPTTESYSIAVEGLEKK
jgi:hypothetical protein